MSEGSLPSWFVDLAERFAQVGPFSTRMGPPPGVHPRRSAVLVLLGDGAHGVPGPDVLLTERATTLRSHAGQVAFPGGRIDPDDAGATAAALREAEEETGLDPTGVHVAGSGPGLYVPPTNHLVIPVLGWWRRPSRVHAVDAAEVARVVRVPIDELADPANRFRVMHPSGYVGAGFAVRGLFVWGFTAGVLHAVLSLGGWERPWDDSRVLPVPEPPDPAAQEAP